MTKAKRSKLGCLLQIIVAAFVLFYGSDWMIAYYKFWSLEDEMRSQADLAMGLDDATIHQRLLATIDRLGLPSEAKSNIRIRRRRRPLEIVISTSYVESLRIPFRPPWERTFHPQARQPLSNF